jgi:opacity protein-like surface antigen
MKFAIAAAALAAAAIASPVFAADAASSNISWYGNIGEYVNHFSDADLTSATVRLGGRATYWGVEGEYATGTSSKNISGVSMKINNQYAAYVVGYLPINNGDVFARLGYGRTAFKGSFGGLSANDTENGYTFGLGAQYFFKGGKDGVRGDFTAQHFDHQDGVEDVFSLAYVRKF